MCSINIFLSCLVLQHLLGWSGPKPWHWPLFSLSSSCNVWTKFSCFCLEFDYLLDHISVPPLAASLIQPSWLHSLLQEHGNLSPCFQWSLPSVLWLHKGSFVNQSTSLPRSVAVSLPTLVLTRICKFLSHPASCCFSGPTLYHSPPKSHTLDALPGSLHLLFHL